MLRRKANKPATPKEKPERQPDFRFTRNDLKKTAEDLPTKDYILKKIEAIPDGDIEALITLRDKIYQYYDIKKPGL